MQKLKRTTSIASTTSHLPPYTALEAAPPAFSGSMSAFPTSFKIKGKVTGALVDTGALQRHLRLLGAFHELKERVLQLESGLGCTEGLSRNARWGVFIAMAVHRFELYIERYIEAPCDQACTELPPLDVALVWHSYLLNPRWYREDIIRIHPRLDKLNNVLLDHYVDTIDPVSFQVNKNVTQIEQWQGRTGTPFEPLEAFACAEGRQVRCPLSGQEVCVPWVTTEGKGYAQQGFSVPSPQLATFKITHEALGMDKFASDIIKARENLGYIASTVYSPAEPADRTATETVAERIRSRLWWSWRKSHMDQTRPEISESMNWSMVEARSNIRQQLGLTGPELLTLLGAYTRGEKFSLDLASAVLRQGTFVNKMYDLGWTRPGRFDTDDVLLQRSVARYHAFLDLISSSPGMFCVPTLDIDLAWHTHQLNSQKYRDDTINLVGRFIDHDDKVEENALSTSYDVTARAWQARFGVPYSICGCPLPDEKTGAVLAAKLGFKGKRPATISALLGDTDSNEDADSTHPSSHNFIHLVGQPDHNKLRSKRNDERLGRIDRDERKAAKGQFDPSTLERSRTHETAFLQPVPLFYGYGTIGYPVDAGAGGCVAVDVNYVKAEGANPAGSVGGSCIAGVGRSLAFGPQVGCAVAGGAGGVGCGGGG